MSQNSNPFMNMTEDELIESCITDNSIMDMAYELLNEWQQQQQSQSSSSSERRRRRAYIDRGREEGHIRLVNDYFSANPVYMDDQFRRRFRMRRHLFLRIVDALENHSPYFQMRVDACNRNGLSPLQKCTAAIRMLAYGMGVDAVDDYVPIGDSTAIECLKKFVRAVIEVFEDEYLRRPTADDVQRLLQMGEARGFLGMIGSIDCMHWEWKNCPAALKGMFVQGYQDKPTIMLEAVASADLWIWHAFFGVPRSNNDINVLDRSSVFNYILEGRSPEVQYTVNGTRYNMGYYLTDSIYPEWAMFVNSIPIPQGPKRQLFAKHHEAARKDVERAFRVLQARFTIVRGPRRMWNLPELGEIMRACIILHNMIVEDERSTYEGNDDFEYDNPDNGIPTPQVSHAPFPAYEIILQNNKLIHNRTKRHQLQADLVEHLWQHFGGNNNH